MYEDEDDEDVTVSLWQVAVWECPSCYERNEREDAFDSSDVTCERCGESFRVSGIYAS